MAREFARITCEIWSDDDFRNLTGPAQLLYLTLLTHNSLSYCGVVDWHPGRIAALTRENTEHQVRLAAAELSYNYFCVFDQGTDEVLVRSFLRHDGLLKQERLHVSAAKAFGSVASNKLRAVIVFELQRFKRENPDLAGWKKPQMMTLLKQTAVSVRETDVEMSMPSGMGFLPVDNFPFGQGFGQRLPQTPGSVSGASTPSPSPSPSPATSSKEDAVHDRSFFSTGGGARVTAIDKAFRLAVE